MPDSVFIYEGTKGAAHRCAARAERRCAIRSSNRVSDSERQLAFANIEKAAKHYGVDLSETSWHDLGAHPQHHRQEAAKKAADTRARNETR